MLRRGPRLEQHKHLIHTHAVSKQHRPPVPGFGDLVLRGQEGVVDRRRGGVAKRRQAQEFNLRQTQGAGIARSVQPQANG